MGYPVGNLRQLSRGRRRCRRRRLPPLRPFSAAVPPLPSFLLRLQKNCKCGLLQAVKGFRRIRRIKRKEGCSSGSSSSDDDASSSNYVIVATSAISTRHVSLRPRQVSSPPRRRGRSHLLLHLPPPPTQECTMASLHLSPVSPHHLPPPPGAELFIPKTRTWTLPQDLSVALRLRLLLLPRPECGCPSSVFLGSSGKCNTPHPDTTGSITESGPSATVPPPFFARNKKVGSPMQSRWRTGGRTEREARAAAAAG